MLQVSAITKHYAGTPILQGVSFRVNPGEHTAIVGPNGSGKTTLLRIIAGIEHPDSGSVSLTPGYQLAYLPQGFMDSMDQPVSSVLQRDAPVWQIHLDLQQAAEHLAGYPDDAAALRHYDEVARRFEDLGGYTRLAAVEDVLRGLALDGLQPDRQIATLSGGQKTRLALASLLLGTPDLLLLDEPTNHLDVDALQWLETFIARFAGAVLLVSHDRAFLDATAATILELDGDTHMVWSYAGGYTAYAMAKEAERDARWQSYKRQQHERKRIEEDIRELKKHAMHTEQATHDSSARRLANKVMRTAIVRERKLEKQLTADTVEKPRAGWRLKLDFAPIPGGAREVLEAAGLCKRFGEHPVLEHLDLHVRYGERLIVTGPNGGGKSTLLKIIAGELTPDAGIVRLGANVVVGYYSQEQDSLDPRQTPLQALRDVASLTETEARTLLHAYLFDNDDVFTPIERLSYGERARLILARLVLSGANFLLLDEPTNHLDIGSREQFEASLTTFRGTVIAVLHDRYAIERLATRVVELRHGMLSEMLA